MTARAATGGAVRAPDPRPDAVGYFRATGPEYQRWSQAGNMHFGYYGSGMDLFDREAQLARLNEEVGARLGLAAADPVRVIDLGCGTGATLRQLLAMHPGWRAVGISNVDTQIEQARAQAREAGLNHRLTVLCEDFGRTSFPAARFDGALAIESFCYGQGYAKRDVLAEARRLLRPGARIVIADAFLRGDEELPRWLEACHQHLCQGWHLRTLPRCDAVRAALDELGFVDVRFEDISAQVAPSALQVPQVTAGYWCELLLAGQGGDRLRRGHTLAPLMALALGLAQAHVGYFLVTATRS